MKKTKKDDDEPRIIINAQYPSNSVQIGELVVASSNLSMNKLRKLTTHLLKDETIRSYLQFRQIKQLSLGCDYAG